MEENHKHVKLIKTEKNGKIILKFDKTNEKYSSITQSFNNPKYNVIDKEKEIKMHEHDDSSKIQENINNLELMDA